jgi:hypothetical protein
LGEATYYLVARYLNEDLAKKACTKIDSIVKGLVFLNDAFQAIREFVSIPAGERLRFLKLLASENFEFGVEDAVFLKLRTGLDCKELVEKRMQMSFPDLSCCFPDKVSENDLCLNAIVEKLPDVNENYILEVCGAKIYLYNTVWHLTNWYNLERLIVQHTLPIAIRWESDETVTVGQLLLEYV